MWFLSEFPWQRVAANKEVIEPRIITLKVLRSPPWLDWPLWNICVTNDHGYLPLLVNTSRSFPRSLFITGFVTRLTRRVPLVEEEMLTLPEHLSSPLLLSGVRGTWSVVLCVCFSDRCLSFCICPFGNCVVCSSIYWLWLPHWYLQTLFATGFRFHFQVLVQIYTTSLKNIMLSNRHKRCH